MPAGAVPDAHKPAAIRRRMIYLDSAAVVELVALARHAPAAVARLHPVLDQVELIDLSPRIRRTEPCIRARLLDRIAVGIAGRRRCSRHNNEGQRGRAVQPLRATPASEQPGSYPRGVPARHDRLAYRMGCMRALGRTL
jgi:hypothetical protein